MCKGLGLGLGLSLAALKLLLKHPFRFPQMCLKTAEFMVWVSGSAPRASKIQCKVQVLASSRLGARFGGSGVEFLDFG